MWGVLQVLVGALGCARVLGVEWTQATDSLPLDGSQFSVTVLPSAVVAVQVCRSPIVG